MKYKLILVKNRKKYLKGEELKEDKDYITLASAEEDLGIYCRWFTLTAVIGKKMSDEYHYRSHGWSNFDFTRILKFREIELYFIKDHNLKNNKIDWDWFETHIVDFNAQRAPFTDPNLFWITVSGV